MTTLRWALCIGLGVLILSVLARTWVQARRTREASPRTLEEKYTDEKGQEEYPPVEPLPDFDWREAEPMKLRPFKPKYHLTMALTRATVSDLFIMDRNYVERMKLRRQVMADHQENVLGVVSIEAKPAVDELYSFLLETYLPTRYPRAFSLTSSVDPSWTRWPPSSDTTSSKTFLKNHATEEVTPVEPPASPLEALWTMGGLVDDELCLLLPSDDGDGYTLKAAVLCFPAGFDTRKKLNAKLRDIHIPVPSYKEKLEKSMDRFFETLEVGKFVRRMNWSVSTDGRLFKPFGNHLYVSDGLSQELKESIREEAAEVVPEQCNLRCELQHLHRLPKTKALLFSFKTFLYPLSELKEEGLGEDLASAIEGLREGNAPGMWYYKKAVVYADSVTKWLRQ